MHSRRRKRRIVVIVLLVLLLALMTALYINYRATKRLSLDFDPSETVAQIPPEYLYSFAGPAADRLSRPLGVLSVADRVYVTDARRGVVDVFTTEGRRVASWGKGVLGTPMYLAFNPVDKHLYVTDRRVRGLHEFDLEGKHLGVYDPKLPKNQLPKFAAGGVKWQPVGVDFGRDGTLYATDILNGHRLLIFAPTGEFRRSIGTAGLVDQADEAPEVFQFPNNVRVFKDEVWVSDSNNRRMKVYSLEGDYLRLIPISGLPRGFGFLNRTSRDASGTPDRFAIVDTLSHDASVWTAEGEKLVVFGGNGVLEGQFSYPNDLAVDRRNRLFVADNLNSRIQVWGWPAELQPIPTPQTPAEWAWCLLPLLLLPLLLLLRKKRFMATPDFLLAVVSSEQVDALPARRRRWVAYDADMEAIEAITLAEQNERLVDLVQFQGEPHSESDAKALMDRLELEPEVARRLVVAQRARVFCTQDPELRRVARLLEIDVVDLDEFTARFANKSVKTKR